MSARKVSWANIYTYTLKCSSYTISLGKGWPDQSSKLLFCNYDDSKKVRVWLILDGNWKVHILCIFNFKNCVKQGAVAIRRLPVNCTASCGHTVHTVQYCTSLDLAVHAISSLDIIITQYSKLGFSCNIFILGYQSRNIYLFCSSACMKS